MVIKSVAIFLLIGALAGASGASAQVTAADSDAVAGAIAQSLLLDLRAPGDHHGPVHFVVSRDSVIAGWTERVAAAIRRDAPGFVSDSGGRFALGFGFDNISVSDRTVAVTGSFFSCIAGGRVIAWDHVVHILIARGDRGWVAAKPGISTFIDGRC